MKIYWIALFVTSSCFLSAAAQDCSKELLQHKPGTWKAGPQGAIFKVSAPDLVKEKTVINTIHKMIAANYQPSGCQLSYSTVYGNNSPVAGKPWLADNYHYVMRIMRYLCDQQAADKTKYYVDISTTTTVNIVANAIFSLNSLYASELGTDDARGYLKLTSVPVKRDGYYFMGAEKVSYNDSIFEYRWLITYNDTLPFSYVSRKEYLLIQKKRLEQDLINSPSDRAYNEKFFKNIANYLTQPETELSKPAICMWNDEERFEKFVSEGTKGSFIAVKPNMAYYHKSLPKSSPQFFSVVFKLDYADPVFKENIAGIQKAVDFAALKNMLGR